MSLWRGILYLEILCLGLDNEKKNWFYANFLCLDLFRLSVFWFNSVVNYSVLNVFVCFWSETKINVCLLCRLWRLKQEINFASAQRLPGLSQLIVWIHFVTLKGKFKNRTWCGHITSNKQKKKIFFFFYYEIVLQCTLHFLSWLWAVCWCVFLSVLLENKPGNAKRWVLPKVKGRRGETQSVN